MKRNDVIGQITVVDYLKEIGAIPSKNVALLPGQVVYTVNLCDIAKYEVYGSFTVNDEKAIILIAREGSESHFKCVFLEDEDEILYQTEAEAKKVALKNLEDCDCILASDMKIKSFNAYVANSPDGRMMTAFYAELTNGYIYIKDFHSVGHLVRCSVREAQENLEREVNTTEDTHPSTKKPVLKNMYRTDKSFFDWDYTEHLCCLSVG